MGGKEINGEIVKRGPLQNKVTRYKLQFIYYTEMFPKWRYC